MPLISAPRRGMTFAFQKASPEVRGERRSVLTNSSETSVILVVDASEERLTRILRAVADAGWIAVGTTDPWEAIVLASHYTLNLIVLDPDILLDGGSDFYTILREDPGLQEVPVIFTAEEHQSWLLRGLDLLLPRSVDASVLLSTMRRLLVSPFPPEEPVEREERFVRRHRVQVA
jgi:DNA-binding response OmpR family regulator